METAQKKVTDAQLRATKKYANSKYRPNVFIDKDRQTDIETHFKNKGYRSFNEYVIALIDSDMGVWLLIVLNRVRMDKTDKNGKTNIK